MYSPQWVGPWTIVDRQAAGVTRRHGSHDADRLGAQPGVAAHDGRSRHGTARQGIPLLAKPAEAVTASQERIERVWCGCT